ncbi:pectate lyase [Novipirellula artificiosorum]|uniref:Pectic acid lyase n=1 Tax=Novipirellula artificiosorum TaxID=2528016 RepID=A0A5C6DXX5_9BACT|nr:pectate lyase [Novipirellula artificiosorum]TWU41094.1 Pectic acid lyase [Novipirellula artificiosorum]
MNAKLIALVAMACGSFAAALDQACAEGPTGPKGPLKSEKASHLEPIDLSPFGSCIHHWRDLRDESRFIQVEKDQPSYRPEQVREIVNNILLFQRSNGGWPKDYDMTAVLTANQRAQVIATRDNDDTSYDNGNLHSQVAYLARAVSQVNDPRWRNACQSGFDFILRSQYAHGGFPQRFPKPNSYHAHITFNDGVMMGILNVLQDAAEGAKHFAWLDDDRRQQARRAVASGIDCILRCQIQRNGKRTGWCQQHHEETFQPQPARTFELASLCPQETTEIVRFLMRDASPSDEVNESVDSAIAWLKTVRLTNLRIEKVKSTRESFLRHDTDIDVVVIQDPNGKPIWARHYEIETDRPVFAGRDGIKKYELASIERERRTGTAWYGTWPQALLEREYPQWRNRK